MALHQSREKRDKNSYIGGHGRRLRVHKEVYEAGNRPVCVFRVYARGWAVFGGRAEWMARRAAGAAALLSPGSSANRTRAVVLSRPREVMEALEATTRQARTATSAKLGPRPAGDIAKSWSAFGVSVQPTPKVCVCGTSG